MKKRLTLCAVYSVYTDCGTNNALFYQ